MEFFRRAPLSPARLGVFPGTFNPVSAIEVRRRIARGEPWEHMAPAAVRKAVRRIYR